MAGLDTKTRLTVLNNAKDFLSWKLDLRIHLKSKKLWTLVDGSRERPKDNASDAITWDDDNDKALAEIIPTLGPTYKAQYQTIELARQLWSALVSQHESQGFVQRYNFLLEIPRLTIGQCNNDINSYCSRFAKLRDEQIVANGSKHQSDNFTCNQLTTFFVGGLQGFLAGNSLFSTSGKKRTFPLSKKPWPLHATSNAFTRQSDPHQIQQSRCHPNHVGTISPLPNEACAAYILSLTTKTRTASFSTLKRSQAGPTPKRIVHTSRDQQ